jgi:hypothetical protein
MLYVKICIQKYERCYDGERSDFYMLKAFWNKSPEAYSWTNYEYPTYKAAETALDKVLSDTYETVTISRGDNLETNRKHIHIGEYGSPKIYECNTI